MSMLQKMLAQTRTLLPMQRMLFASRVPKVPNQVYRDPNASKFQEARMLFFGKKSNETQKINATRPKTIQEIKKLQSFVKAKKA